MLQPVADKVAECGEFLRAEIAARHGYLPSGDKVLRAFERPLDDVRVLIVGQDPYPTPGDAVGWAFSVSPDRPIPASLRNIFQELTSDIGCPPPSAGDLSPWVEQGVLLLNRVLTVRPGASGSHHDIGWEHVTAAAITGLVQRGGPLVAILWGGKAGTLSAQLGQIPYVTSAHPSPLSAYRGFFGSRPFSKVNHLLTEQGAEPIDWSLA